MDADQRRAFRSAQVAKRAFGVHYNSVKIHTPFNDRYKQAGLFLPLMSADLRLTEGEVVAMHTGPYDRRRLLVLKTLFGNVIIFDMHADGDQPSRPNAHILGCHVPDEIQKLLSGIADFSNNMLPYPGLECLLGRSYDASQNIGLRLVKLRNEIHQREEYANERRA